MPDRGNKAWHAVLWLVIAVTGLLNFGPLFGVSDDANAALTLLGGVVFCVIHGGLAFGWKHIAVYLAITVAVSFTSEALGVATGLVFGSYYYTDNLGPKILGVPPLIQCGYAAVSYASLVTARIILGALGTPPGRQWAAVALATACLMVSWDVAMDPYQSTLAGDWIWRDGGAHYGVPLHNYAGWFATVLLYLLIYMAWERAHPVPPPAGPRARRLLWAMPVIYYGMIAMGIIVVPFIGGYTGGVAAPQNLHASLGDLAGSLTLIATFVMGTPIVFALLRLPQVLPAGRD